MRASTSVSSLTGLIGGEAAEGFWSSRFTDTDPHTGRTRLCAVVAWKGKGQNIKPTKPLFPWVTRWVWTRLPTSPRLQWWFSKWMFARHVLPKIIWDMRPRLRSSMVRELEAGWGASVGDGKNKVEFNRATRAVRIRGRVFTPRDERTFVVLVEDDRGAPAGIRVTELSVETVPGDPAQAWNRALNADPVYAEFIRAFEARNRQSSSQKRPSR